MHIREILKKTKEIRIPGKKLISNYYMNYNPENNDEFDVYESDKSILFYIKENNIYRLYFYTNDTDDLITLLRNNIKRNEVIEIVGKESLDQYMWLEKAGFSWYKTYERYGNPLQSYEETLKKYEAGKMNAFYNEKYGILAEEKDIAELQELIKTTFDEKSDHLFSDKELKELIQNKNIYIEKEDGRIYCMYIFKIEGKKIYHNSVINKGTADVLYSIERKTVLNAILEHNVSYSYYWIEMTNKRALKRTDTSIKKDISNYIFVR